MDVGASSILLDCGPGTIRTLARLGLPWESLNHLMVTHFHTDHVADVAPLLFALKHASTRDREKPLDLLGPPGLIRHLTALAEAHGSFILDPGFPVRIHEVIPGGDWQDSQTGILVRTFPTRHTPQSLAVRVESQGDFLGYTGDTGPLEGMGSFFRGCGILIAECSHPDGKELDTHLSPGRLAAMAGRACPELLVTVHVYPPLLPGKIPGLLADAGYSGRVLPGWDGLGLDLSGGEIREMDPPEHTESRIGPRGTNSGTLT